MVYSTPEETTPEPDWVSKSYAYTDSNHVHAVSSVVVTNDQNNQTTNTYLYDGNGNMTCRTEDGDTFIQSYNWENRLSGVELVSGNCTTPGETQKEWAFTYDGDGSRVKQVYTVGTTVTTTYYFMGGSYEVQVVGSTETVRQYYSIAGMAIGMRELVNGLSAESPYYFLTDHLGSVVGVTDSTGTLISETRYLPFGEVRTDVGTQYGVAPTDFGYTFQRNLPEMGLLDYRARFYSPSLGRFIQPDSIVPGAGNPQLFNRYSYTSNSPINFTDPTGHMSTGACGAYGDDCGTPSSPEPTDPPDGTHSDKHFHEEKPIPPAKTKIHEREPVLPLLGSNQDIIDLPVIGPQCLSSTPCLYTWEIPWYFDLNPNNPDYLSFNVQYGLVYSVGLSLIVDRYGQVYFSLQPVSIGKSLTPLTVSIVGGNFYDPIENDVLPNFMLAEQIKGWSINGSVGALGVLGINQSINTETIPRPAFESGMLLPAAMGVSVGYTWQIIRN